MQRAHITYQHYNGRTSYLLSAGPCLEYPLSNVVLSVSRETSSVGRSTIESETIKFEKGYICMGILTPGPALLWLFVFIHTISSHLRKPHLASTSRPRSRPSPAPLPTQRNTKLGSPAREGMGRSISSFQVKEEEKGGSMRTTSNLQGRSESMFAKEIYAGGWAQALTEAFFNVSRRCCFGYLWADVHLCKRDECDNVPNRTLQTAAQALHQGPSFAAILHRRYISAGNHFE